MEVYITELAEYELCKKRGFEPLIDSRFGLSFELRIHIQNKLFSGSIPQRNNKYYKWNWSHKLHKCEECNMPLEKYNSIFISHIITKGSHPEIAFDPRNSNILCPKHHEQWENPFDRKLMRIYKNNSHLIKILKDEYYQNRSISRRIL